MRTLRSYLRKKKKKKKRIMSGRLDVYNGGGSPEI